MVFVIIYLCIYCLHLIQNKVIQLFTKLTNLVSHLNYNIYLNKYLVYLKKFNITMINRRVARTS